MNDVARNFVDRRAIHGDLWSMDGVKIVSTNLGGVHGRGLAAQAKAKGLITPRNRSFHTSPVHGEVICIAVKGSAPETARIPGRMFSESVTAGNVTLMDGELKCLVDLARTTPKTNYFVPFIGLGFGEGHPEVILPMLLALTDEPNIFLVTRDDATTKRYASSFRPGVRRDATYRNPDPSSLKHCTKCRMLVDLYAPAMCGDCRRGA